MINSMKEIYEYVNSIPAAKAVVCQAADSHVLHAVDDAKKLGMIHPILVGNTEDIKKIAAEEKIDLADCEFVNADSEDETIKTAITMAHNGEADILIKGQVASTAFMKGILNKEYGIRDGRKRLSILTFIELKNREKLLFMTDCAINPLPDLDTKKELIEGSVAILKDFGIVNPKVAVLSAAEKLNPKMQSSVEAYELMQMNERGEIGGCVIDGPTSFDLAVSTESAQNKKYDGKIKGDADVVIVPSLETGNALYKTLMLFVEMETAGMMMGSTVPVVWSSRTDAVETKRNGIALAIYLADKRKGNK